MPNPEEQGLLDPNEMEQLAAEAADEEEAEEYIGENDENVFEEEEPEKPEKKVEKREETPSETPDVQHAPAMDHEVETKLRELADLKKDQEIQQIIQRRDEEARQAQEYEAKMASRKAQIDAFFNDRIKRIAAMAADGKTPADEFVKELHVLTNQTMEAREQELVAQMHQIMDEKLADIATKYDKERSFFDAFPELGKMSPEVKRGLGQVVTQMVGAGIPEQAIGYLINAVKQSSTPRQPKQPGIPTAAQVARQVGASETPTKIQKTGAHKANELDREIDQLIDKELFGN